MAEAIVVILESSCRGIFAITLLDPMQNLVKRASFALIFIVVLDEIVTYSDTAQWPWRRESHIASFVASLEAMPFR